MKYSSLSGEAERRTRLYDQDRRAESLRRLPEPSPAAGGRAQRVVDILVLAAVVVFIAAGLVLWVAGALLS